MLDQYELIHNTDWQTLIILDAARYDYFKKLNKFKGKLIKARSRAPHTYRWLEETFPDKYNWTYFSAHPYINSIPMRKSWNARDHFKSIVSIWAYAWNDELGTVHPHSVGRMLELVDYEKAVIHYIQPHGPWIGKTRWAVPWTLEQHEKHGVMADYVAQVVKPEPKMMRKYYRDNLKLVLYSIDKFRDNFKGQVIITADHGEMLGEKGLYLHKENYPKWADDLLREVPFFIWDRSPSSDQRSKP